MFYNQRGFIIIFGFVIMHSVSSSKLSDKPIRVHENPVFEFIMGLLINSSNNYFCTCLYPLDKGLVVYSKVYWQKNHYSW